MEVVEETFKGHSVRLFGQKKEGNKKIGGASLHLPKIRKNPLIEIIGKIVRMEYYWLYYQFDEA